MSCVLISLLTHFDCTNLRVLDERGSRLWFSFGRGSLMSNGRFKELFSIAG